MDVLGGDVVLSAVVLLLRGSLCLLLLGPWLGLAHRRILGRSVCVRSRRNLTAALMTVIVGVEDIRRLDHLVLRRGFCKTRLVGSLRLLEVEG